MEAPFLPPVSAGLFWCLVFDVFLAQFDLKENQCGGSALCAQRSPQRCRTGATGSFAAIRESVSRNVLPDLIKRYRRSCALADPTRCDRHLVPLQCLDGRLDRIDLPFRHHLVGHDRLPFGCSCFTLGESEFKAALAAGRRRSDGSPRHYCRICLAGDVARAATSDEVHELRRESTALKEVVADLT